MARSIDEIKLVITNKYVAEMAAIEETVDPATWSVTSLERLLIYVVAFCQFILEKIFDTHKIEVADIITNTKPGTRDWLKNKVLNFQYGYALPIDSDEYDNTALTQQEIDDSKIVKYCAVTDRGDIVTIKVAIGVGSSLQPLDGSQLAALQAYVALIKYGGVFISIVNEVADSLKLTCTINYLPLILDSNGINKASGEEVVKAAIEAYLKNIVFNGEFATQDLTDALQAVDGIKYATPTLVQVKADAGAAYEDVAIYYKPASGYLRFTNPAHLNLVFVPYSN